MLIEARHAELLEGRPGEIRSAWVDPADVEALAAKLEKLAEFPGTEAVRGEFRVDAQRYDHLARSMRARDDLPHGRAARAKSHAHHSPKADEESP